MSIWYLFQAKMKLILTLNLLNFLNEIIHLPFCLNCLLSFLGISRWKLEVGQPSIYWAWSDCMDVLTGLALHWRQRLIVLGCSRIRLNARLLLHNIPSLSKDFAEKFEAIMFCIWNHYNKCINGCWLWMCVFVRLSSFRVSERTLVGK